MGFFFCEITIVESGHPKDAVDAPLGGEEGGHQKKLLNGSVN